MRAPVVTLHVFRGKCKTVLAKSPTDLHFLWCFAPLTNSSYRFLPGTGHESKNLNARFRSCEGFEKGARPSSGREHLPLRSLFFAPFFSLVGDAECVLGLGAGLFGVCVDACALCAGSGCGQRDTGGVRPDRRVRASQGLRDPRAASRPETGETTVGTGEPRVRNTRALARGRYGARLSTTSRGVNASSCRTF